MAASTASELHNSGCSQSGKTTPYLPPRRRADAFKLAARLARQLAIIATWPTVQIIRLAIESEADYRCVSLAEAAALILECAKAHLERGVAINRFYFEDAKWRSPFIGLSKAEIVSLKNRIAAERVKQFFREQAEKFASQQCFRCQDSGQIWNDGPGPRRIPCPDCQETR